MLMNLTPSVKAIDSLNKHVIEKSKIPISTERIEFVNF